MKTYVSLGIGDAIAIDSLLTQKERNNISELYWACRFGVDVAPLFHDNPFYPNLRQSHFIDDALGQGAMRGLDPVAVNFWHMRPDFPRNKQVGLSLFGLSSIENTIDGAGLLGSDRGFTNSSFIDMATEESVNWVAAGVKPNEYILFHYPTSTRPRSDIASIIDSDWNFVENLSSSSGLPVLIITDTDITPPLSNYLLHKKYPIREIMGLCKYAAYYCGCDSFISISCCKCLPPERLFIKSHKPNIQADILTNKWQQKYFLPLSPEVVSQIYKPYIG